MKLVRVICVATCLFQVCTAVAVLGSPATGAAVTCGLLVNATYRSHSPSGCACNAQPGDKYGVCAPGYVCAQPWGNSSTGGADISERLEAAAVPAGAVDIQLSPTDTLRQLVAAGPSFPTVPPVFSGGLLDNFYASTGQQGSRAQLGQLSSAVASRLPAATHVCQPCSYGQYCPEGSMLPPADSPSIQLALQQLQCPAGKYCPSPAEAHDCPPGAFCGAGAVQPVTCNMTELVTDYPSLLTPGNTPTVLERVYLLGDILAGNSCPANSATPSMPCQAGWYCPEPGLSLPCPPSHFCKAGSQAPHRCPRLAHCPQGSASASLSGSGLLILAMTFKLVCCLYCILLVLIRAQQKRVQRAQEASERLSRLLGPLFTPRCEHRHPSLQAFKTIRTRLHIEFENLGLTLHDGTTILSRVTGRFSHSKVAAIMGVSGAGKTTMLNVLMGRAAHLGRTEGVVRVNSMEMRLGRLRDITGFVPQEDIVHEDLTVRENLVFSARLRVPHNKPRREQLAKVDDVISMLQLRHVQHQVVGTVERRGISETWRMLLCSGGQRKRVNIGWELVTRPSVLFLDEPTSGLDATSAVGIIQALKRMACLGMNVVTVIHQPRYSTFRLFDNIMLLGNGGRMVYLGPSHLALPYFESLGFALPHNENPADFCLDVISGSVPRADSATFQPDDLLVLWQAYGVSWVRTQSNLMPAEPQPQVLPRKPSRLDPHQLQLLEQAFDGCDADGDGAVSGAQLRGLLRGLGLEPTQQDVNAIMRDLATPRTGLVSKDTFMQYVRHGGCPPSDDTASDGKKRASIYRVHSVEHYTLANAMSELSSSCLPPGLLDGGATLKQIAAAAMAHGVAGHTPLGAAMPPGHSLEAGLKAVHHPEAAGGDPAIVGAPTSAAWAAGTEAGPSTAAPLTSGAPDLVRDSAASFLTTASQSSSSSDAPLRNPGMLRLLSPPASAGASSAEQHRRNDSSRTATPVSVRIPAEALQSPFSMAPQLHGASSGATSPHPHNNGASGSRHGLTALRPCGRSSDSTGASALCSLDSYATEQASTGHAAADGTRGSSQGQRGTPGVAQQFWTLLMRAGTKWARGWPATLLNLLLLMLAGAVTGALHGNWDGAWSARWDTALVMLTLGTISAATSLPVLGKDRVVFWREHASGVKILPYFLAHSTVHLIDIATQPLVFLAAFYSLVLPAISFLQYYLVGLLVVWYCSSLGCLISVLVRPSNAVVAAVAVTLVVGGFLNGTSPNYKEMSPALKRASGASFNRWAIEAVCILDFGSFPRHMWPTTRAIMSNAGYCGLDRVANPSNVEGSTGGTWQPAGPDEEHMNMAHYCQGYAAYALVVLALEGLVLRLATYIALHFAGTSTLESAWTAITALLQRIMVASCSSKRSSVRRKLSRSQVV